MDKLKQLSKEKILELNLSANQEAQNNINFWSTVKDCDHEWCIEVIGTSLDGFVRVKALCKTCNVTTSYTTSVSILD
jgi:hypothetical protein